jgi:uncharacterized protein YecE (DUF72 family)
MATRHIGTSGWSYDHWHGPFYPPELPAADRLAHYATRLGSVEIDSSFYRLPGARALRPWLDQGLDVYCYFDNDEAGHAVRNALTLDARLAGS